MKEKIIIPDVHGRTFWREPLKNQEINKYDKIIFLGDYLDPYEHENITPRQAIDIFKEIIQLKKDNPNKVILLIGNHDIEYWSPFCNIFVRYDNVNSKEIEILFNENKNLFSLAHEETINGKRYLFSHAGLMNFWYNTYKDLIGELNIDNLNRLLYSKEGIEALCQLSFFRTKYTYNQSGSIIWSDVREKLRDKDDAIVQPFDFQFFGHTQQIKDPIITENWACLDCRKAFILNDDGTFFSA